jgi:Zn-finger protein
LDFLTTYTSISPIRRGFAPAFVNYKKGCTRLAAASDKVYQLLAHGLWFSPGTPASSTTKTGCHDIDQILLKVTLNSKNQSTKYICSCDLWHLLTSNMAFYYFSAEQGTSYTISSWHGIYIYWCSTCCQWIHKTGRLTIIITYIVKVKLKWKKYQTDGTFSNSKMKILERGKIDTRSTNKWPLIFPVWYRHFNTITCGGHKLVL